MKLSLRIVIALVVLMPSALRSQTCDQTTLSLFSSGNDLNPLHQCIRAYNGYYQYLSQCSLPALHTPAAYGLSITVGPLQWASRISLTYYAANNNDRILVEYATAWNPSSWNLVDDIYTTKNRCITVTTSAAIPTGTFFRISQPTAPQNGTLSISSIMPIDPLPAELVSFNAGRVGSSVKLTWKTATEQNNYGFEIERRSGGDWQNVAFVAGHGSSNTPQNYVYMDRPNVASGEVQYRLRQIDRDGSATYSPIASVSMGAIKGFGLRSAYPNPFNPTTTLSFELTQDATVTLKIFNESGQEVTTLVSGEYMTAGSYSRIFQGGSLPSGNYVAWLFTDGESSLLPLTLAK